MTYRLTDRERKLLDHLQMDDETFQIRGQLPVGTGEITLHRLTELGLLETGGGRFGETGWRLTDNGWRCMYGKSQAEMMTNGERNHPLKVWSWPPTLDGSATAGQRHRRLQTLAPKLGMLPPKVRPLD
ncbi:hypothetical protein MRBLMA1_000521 [Sphingobium sp. LMA1-1-1.1]|uniref:hypothetical protein n=1 Tax=Sphingobium sp. LMA1-1-1.1 TaxID=3135238 RepID=UPI003449FB94